jgi:hypothetical protein
MNDTDNKGPGEAAGGFVSPFETAGATRPSRIDDCILRRLKQVGISPSPICSDEVFVRRVFLDLIGTLPTPVETEQFLNDRSAGKRAALVDGLLRRDEFADYWALKWCDILRVKSEFPIDLWPNAVQAYHHWVRSAIRANMPIDRFVVALLTSSGSNFRDPEVNFYRTVQGRKPEGIAQNVALTLMGARAERWPAQRLARMAGFFAQIGFKATGEWKEEIVFFDPTRPPAGSKASKLPPPLFPDGVRPVIAEGRDPREVFAAWLVSSKNPWFATSIANRIWYWLTGVGVVNDPDDIRPDNPPSNPELMSLLRNLLIASRYDLTAFCRQICCSAAYQRSSIARGGAGARSGKQAESAGAPEPLSPSELNFASYHVRRLEAEVLIDAIDQITGTAETYSSPIPEPFTFIPESNRTIALADGSIGSTFLDMFGRPSRDTGLASERNDRITSAQRLHLLNSRHVETKIERGPAMLALVRAKSSQQELVKALYLRILSRFPTAAEMAAVDDYAKRTKLYRAGLATDVAWALINSTEFLYRH